MRRGVSKGGEIRGATVWTDGDHSCWRGSADVGEVGSTGGKTGDETTIELKSRRLGVS